jgi:hypothetical protein
MTSDDGIEQRQFEAMIWSDPEVKAAAFHANLLKGFGVLHKKLYIASPERIAEVAAILPEVRDDVISELANMETWIAGVRKALQSSRKLRRYK